MQIWIFRIITDVDKLQKAAEVQKNVNKAQYIVYSEGVLMILRNSGYNPLSDSVLICGHEMCQCKAENCEKMNKEIVDGLKNIIKKRKIKKFLHNIEKRRKGSALTKAIVNTLFNDNGDKSDLAEVILEEAQNE